MKKNIKILALGFVTGCMLLSSIDSGAMSSNVGCNLETFNPWYGTPYGYAETMAHIQANATIKVSKSGYTTKSASVSRNFKHPGTVTTDTVSGPTWVSEGTVFRGEHSGYNADGTYSYKTTYKSY